MRRLRCPILLLAAALIFALSSAPAGAAVHALVVGADSYQHEPKLEGAVDDARDIAGALQRLGAAVTVLLDLDATRSRFEKHWAAVVAAAKPGDTVVLAFAGHGTQELMDSRRQRVNAFLLPHFDRSSKTGLTERITNDEVLALFESVDRAIRIIFVADTCHSGSMMRSVDPRSANSERTVAPYGLPDWAEVPVRSRRSANELKNVTFLAATEDDRKIQAVPIEGKQRGALSYAFARALERAAQDGGKLKRVHLESYLRPTVRQLSEGRQIPKLLPREGDPADVLLEGAGTTTTTLSLTSTQPLRVKALNLPANTITALVSNLKGATLATGGERADLIWDARDGSVVTGQGDLAAYNINAAQLQAIVDRWRAVNDVKQLALKNPLAMSLSPSDERHPTGQKIEFLSEPPKSTFLTSFNLEADGTIRLLYPHARRGDHREWPLSKGYRLELRVTPPYGADHLVVIASSSLLDALHEKLPRSSAADLGDLLKQSLAGIEHQVGIQALYTFDAKMGR